MVSLTYLRIVLQKQLYNAPHGLLLGCMPGVLNRVEAEVIERVQNYSMGFILSKPPWTDSQ